MKRRITWLAMLSTLVGCLIAGTASGANSSPTAGGTMVVRGLNVDWPNFDFQANNRNDVVQPILAAYDRLLAYGPGLKLVPYLAKSWTVKPAQRPKAVTFALRSDATCADGTPVTPVVILNSFKRLISVSKVVNLFSGNFGPGPFHLSANNKKGTFTFRTETPFSNLLNGFAWAGSSIVCPDGLQALASDSHALENKMYGSGPYTLTSANHADQIVYKLRPEWKWGPLKSSSKTLPSTLIYRYLPNETTAANLLIAGGLDLGWATGPDAARLKDASSLVHKVAQNYSTTMLEFNMNPGRPLLDIRLRQALMTAIDPVAWNEAAYGGFGVVTRSPLLPSMACYNKKVAQLAPKPSIDRAASILASAGYRLTDGKLLKDGSQVKLRLITPSNASATAGEYVLSLLTKLGIAVDLGGAASYGADAVTGNFDVGFITGTQVAPVVGTLPSGPPPPKGNNFANTGAGDATLNRLARLATQYAGAKGCALYSQLQELYLEKFYLYGISAPTQQMASRGWDFLPVQLWEVYSFKKK